MDQNEEMNLPRRSVEMNDGPMPANTKSCLYSGEVELPRPNEATW